jgi:DNA-binding NtrC family response regulator
LSVSKQAIEQLALHPFPGNIRELRNVLERAIVLTRDDVIPVEVISIALLMGRRYASRDCRSCENTSEKRYLQPQDTKFATPAKTKRATQREKLREALVLHENDRHALALTLGISMRTLYRRLEELNKTD